MALQLIYQMFSKLLGWMVRRGSSDMTKEIGSWFCVTSPPCSAAARHVRG
jgi:hypothetical protein